MSLFSRLVIWQDDSGCSLMVNGWTGPEWMHRDQLGATKVVQSEMVSAWIKRNKNTDSSYIWEAEQRKLA